MNPEVCNDIQTGRKRAAMNPAPGTPHRECNPMHHASAADFSPTHFVEPWRDVPIPQEGALDNHHDLTSLMRNTPMCSRTQVLTLLSMNPLLQTWRDNNAATHMPSPTNSQLRGYCTSDVNVAWAATEGLIPIPKEFAALGYMPAIVGGMSLEVHSPGSQRQSTRGSMKWPCET